MEGGERAVAPPAQPHRFGSGGGVGGSEFFICFTSRPSSSSMRIPSSKSLPSPGRADKYRDPAAAAPSLSASLSRRLKSSGSVKGGHSPATIPAAGGSRRKGCAFEAAEPSSPKVTCIGQVKVKTARMKKKKKTLRSGSKRATRGGGEATFRRLEEKGGDGDAGCGGEDRECLPNRHQRWVHLPLGSICDALRDLNCFLPCGGGGRSHCSSAGVEREKVERAGGDGGGNRVTEKRARGGGMGSCGAAFARWLMAVQESEGVKRGEIVELVVEEVERRGMARELRGMDMLVDAEKGGLVMERREGWPGGAAPVAVAAAVQDDGETVCVPPPNALLLMRCRSDPVRMAALATRFWGSPAAATARVEVERYEEDHDEEDEVDSKEDEDPDGHAVQDGEEPGKAAGQGEEGGAQPAPASLVAETGLKEGLLEMASEESSGICNREVESEEGKMLPLSGREEQQQQHCQEKGERDGGSGHCAEATPELDRDDPLREEEEEAPKIEKPALEKEDAAGLTGSPSLVASMDKSELLLPAREPEEVAPGKEEAATKSAKPVCCFSERYGRRPSFSNEKEDGRRCSSKEREGRRHSFSTEKEVRRTSSFRDKEGRRSSFCVEGDALRPSLCAEAEGRRRWSFSSEKEVVRRPLVKTTAEAAAVVMEKKRKKKKKREGEEEPGVAREEDPAAEARSFDRPATAAAEAAAEEVGSRGEKREELPDCLLLMMYEPKLSMEVSRETWVCTSDFLRYRPHHHRQQPQQQQQQQQPSREVGAAQGGDVGPTDGDGPTAENKLEVTASSDAASLPNPSPPPPPPLPAADAPAAAASPTPGLPPEAARTPEKKPASAAASSPYGAPFGLTRCKSEPMRSSAKLEPDACFWKSRHRPIGAAGIGF